MGGDGGFVFLMRYGCLKWLMGDVYIFVCVETAEVTRFLLSSKE